MFSNSSPLNLQHPESSPISFALDVHLGKLARELRMLGFDSAWSQSFTDPALLELIQTEHRILLTRDRALYLSAPPEQAHYVQAIKPKQQLTEVVDQFSLQPLIATERFFLTRCLECNRTLVTIHSGAALERVPQGILERHNEFFLCPGCQRIYWKGSHFDKMRKRALSLFSKELILSFPEPPERKKRLV